MFAGSATLDDTEHDPTLRSSKYPKAAHLLTIPSCCDCCTGSRMAHCLLFLFPFVLVPDGVVPVCFGWVIIFPSTGRKDVFVPLVPSPFHHFAGMATKQRVSDNGGKRTEERPNKIGLTFRLFQSAHPTVPIEYRRVHQNETGALISHVLWLQSSHRTSDLGEESNPP